MVTEPSIDPALVERYLREMAEIGKYGDTGVWRPVYSPAWLEAQNTFESWYRDAGLQARRDAAGTVWGRLPGSENGKSIVSGSHIDSQRPGGRFDGTLGAIAGLVAIRALKEQCGTPRRTLEAVSLCEEESSRFPGANFWASRAITGQIGPEEPFELRDYDGETMARAMEAVGLDPNRLSDAIRTDIDAFLELHIEQGPVLEAENLPVGIVTGITGLQHVVVEIPGRADHAGAAPMDLRRDPMPVAAEIISAVVGIARDMGRPAVTTVGRISVEPNLPAAVPEKVTFTIDARHPDADQRQAMYARQEAVIEEIRARTSFPIRRHRVMEQPPCPCNPELVRLLEETAHELSIPIARLHSGAGHDSQVLARIARTAMIFVRSKNGRSHTPEEFTSLDDAVAGIRVLAGALYKLAY